MGWDIVWAILWGVAVILNAIDIHKTDLWESWLALSLSLGNFVAFIASAIISGKIRNETRAAAAARDIEAAGYSTGGSTAAAQAPAKALDVAPVTVVWPSKS